MDEFDRAGGVGGDDGAGGGEGFEDDVAEGFVSAGAGQDGAGGEEGGLVGAPAQEVEAVADAELGGEG